MYGRPELAPLSRRFFSLFAVVYLYAFPYFDQLRSANEMPRILMTQQMVDHGVFYEFVPVEDLGAARPRRHTVADVDHMGLLEDPAGAEVTVKAITDVVASVRNHTPLRSP